jgi:hypothetical protein
MATDNELWLRDAKRYANLDADAKLWVDKHIRNIWECSTRISAGKMRIADILELVQVHNVQHKVKGYPVVPHARVRRSQHGRATIFTPPPLHFTMHDANDEIHPVVDLLMAIVKHRFDEGGSFMPATYPSPADALAEDLDAMGLSDTESIDSLVVEVDAMGLSDVEDDGCAQCIKPHALYPENYVPDDYILCPSPDDEGVGDYPLERIAYHHKQPF